MTDTLPLEKILGRFRALGREEKMQALLQYARRLEPVPPAVLAQSRDDLAVPECQTRVLLFHELQDGKLHFYADVDARQSPTVAAFLSILFSVINDRPPEATLAIPGTFVRDVMDGIGLAAREAGLQGILTRVQRYAAAAAVIPSEARNQ